MSKRLTKKTKETFESIKRIDEDGKEFWTARDLYKILEYNEYRNFLPAARKAWTACKESGLNPNDHFVPFHDMVTIGSGAERQIDNIKMSRYACYLTVQNANSSKPIVAQAQIYFAIQTRRAEILLDNAPLTEEEQRRLLLRSEMKKHNVQLAGAAKNAGVETSKDYAVFQNAGYEGLYAGLNKQDIDTDSRPLYWEFPGKQRAIRYAGWKCVTVKKNAPLELYRIKEDPAEQHDLAAENPEVVKELDQMMHRLRTPSPNYPIDNE